MVIPSSARAHFDTRLRAAGKLALVERTDAVSGAPCCAPQRWRIPHDALLLRWVMHDDRIALFGFTGGMVERLKAIGLMSEIISWKLRLFVPSGATGALILGMPMQRHPLIRIADRAVA